MICECSAIEVLRWGLVIVSIPLVVLLVRHSVRRARALSGRIDEYHEEQESQAKTPGPINPYKDMAELFGVPPEPTEDKKEDQE